jgi:phosphoglycolate phosphatase
MTTRILVLFDIDGTLLRAAGCGRAATELAMREVFGTVGGLTDYRFEGRTDWNTLLHLLTPEGFSESEIEAALPRYGAALFRHMTEIIGRYEVQALPGARELVSALARNPSVTLGIVTGNMQQTADVKLRAAGFDPGEFAVVAYGSEAPLRRLLVPLVLERAERHVGRPFSPANVVFVGDTPDDIDCAHSIGGRAIAVATGFVARSELEKHPPVTILDSLADLDAVMRIILGETS